MDLLDQNTKLSMEMDARLRDQGPACGPGFGGGSDRGDFRPASEFSSEVDFFEYWADTISFVVIGDEKLRFQFITPKTPYFEGDSLEAWAHNEILGHGTCLNVGAVEMMTTWPREDHDRPFDKIRQGSFIRGLFKIKGEARPEQLGHQWLTGALKFVKKRVGLNDRDIGGREVHFITLLRDNLTCWKIRALVIGAGVNCEIDRPGQMVRFEQLNKKRIYLTALVEIRPHSFEQAAGMWKNQGYANMAWVEVLRLNVDGGNGELDYHTVWNFTNYDTKVTELEYCGKGFVQGMME